MTYDAAGNDLEHVLGHLVGEVEKFQDLCAYQALSFFSLLQLKLPDTGSMLMIMPRAQGKGNGALVAKLIRA